MTDFEKRIYALQKLVITRGLGALLVTTQNNIFYLTGIRPDGDLKELYCLVTTHNFYPFVASTYAESAKKQCQHGELLVITADKKLSDYIIDIAIKESLGTIGFEANDLTVASLVSLRKKIKKARWKQTDQLVESLRITKDSQEMGAIVQAVKLTDSAFTFIIPKIKPGLREKDIALSLEMYLREHGDLAFSPIVASGEGSSSPHYLPGEKKISAGEMVLLDFGAKIGGYCADITRMVFVGKATQKYTKVYETVVASQEKTLTFLAERIKEKKHTNRATKLLTKDVDAIARKYVQGQGFPDIPHGVGHALGLDVHEAPRFSPLSKEFLTHMMVFTVEPGIYIPGWGGVRIEDTVAWTDTGFEVLTKSTKKLIEL